jgi:hypothetical protein
MFTILKGLLVFIYVIITCFPILLCILFYELGGGDSFIVINKWLFFEK